MKENILLHKYIKSSCIIQTNIKFLNTMMLSESSVQSEIFNSFSKTTVRFSISPFPSLSAPVPSYPSPNLKFSLILYTFSVYNPSTQAAVEITSFKRNVQPEAAVGVQKPQKQNNYFFWGNKYLAVTCSAKLRGKVDM